MIPALDAYSYHRYFGHHYPDLEIVPDWQMTTMEFLDRANAFGVGGVSLESCFFTDLNDAVVGTVRKRLDALELRRVWAWGHPLGLHSGRSEAALEDLLRNVAIADQIGARTMRICAGGRGTRPETWEEHRKLLLPMLGRAVEFAGARDITLAIENHLDLYSDELLELLETINSPYLGVCLDTANNLRMFEDPIDVARTLASWVKATHIKDVTAFRGNPKAFGFWPSVTVGEGVVDIPAILKILSEAGYQGLLALEIDFLHPRYSSEDQVIKDSLSNLRGMLAELREQQAAHSG